MSDKNKKKKWITILGTIGVCIAYRAIKGKGVFNRIHFKEQHDAVSRYVSSHYPNATYSEIEEAGDGWTTVISTTTIPVSKIVLHITKLPGGVFVFQEAALS